MEQFWKLLLFHRRGWRTGSNQDSVGVIMKVFQILNGLCHREYPEYKSAEEARRFFAPTIVFVDAPNWVWEGYGFDGSKSGDNRFIRPALSEGWTYDEETGLPRQYEAERAMERKNRHAETTNDTMQALRKIREGDNSIDWAKWLDMLDAYNLAIEETKNQKDYPLKVIYPEYPTRPTK